MKISNCPLFSRNEDRNRGSDTLMHCSQNFPSIPYPTITLPRNHITISIKKSTYFQENKRTGVLIYEKDPRPALFFLLLLKRRNVASGNNVELKIIPNYISHINIQGDYRFCYSGS